MHLSKLVQQYNKNDEFYCVYIVSYYKNEGGKSGVDVVIPGIKIHNVHRKWKESHG